MSTENTPSHPSTAAPQPVLTPAEKLALSRQALHAASLGFTHPVTGERLEFTSDLPADMEALLGALRRAG